MTIVLDASAVLAILNDEPGAEIALARLDEAIMSAVNATEVVTRLVDSGLPSAEAWEALALLDIPIRPFDAETARLAADLRLATRSRGLSLGDRACLALAIAERGTAMTADQAWMSLKLACAVVMIR